jgi:aryl-alcohol dehydrogenase-like predicted oxidoreductase
VIPRAPFGRTGHDSTRTLFGAAALSSVSQEVADGVLAVLERHGINHIDTAASYGEAELRIAPWLAGSGRDRFFVATKTGQRTYRDARDEIRRSLQRLGTSYVDLLQLHNLVDQTEWETALGPDGALRAVVEARDAGLVRFIGVTGHGLRAPAQHHRSLERFPFDSVLFPYNYVQLQSAAYAADVAALMRACEERGVAMQTIKAITLGPWQAERPATPTTWYEPLHDERDIALAVRWVLGDQRVFLNTVGDVGLLPLVFEAASRGGARPSDAEMDDLLMRREMSPLFVS